MVLSFLKITLRLFICLLIISPISVMAASYDAEDGELPPPPELYELQTIEREFFVENDDETPLPLDIRLDALKEAALSYGARGGLSWRTYYIRQELKTRARYLDKIFNFKHLLIAAPSGMLIEPPIISEMYDAMLIVPNGRQAAVADRVLNIGRNAQIVSTARTWNLYLERQWDEVAPPPDILRPVDEEEREIWIRHINMGWEKGVEQADEIFQADLNRLVADYQGMVRYRSLLAQGMVSPPYAMQVDRGVTGDGRTMRIGDRELSITDPSKLQAKRYKEWQPVGR